jgi:hypothetical protein
MRRSFQPQIELGFTLIEEIRFNPRSRYDIPKILRGLQFIYSYPTTRDDVFEVLQCNIGVDINFENGRPGMNFGCYWCWALCV